MITTIGTTAVQTMKQFAPKAKVISMPDNSQALSALESGQGVAVTTDNAILYGLADQNRSTKVVGKPFTNQPYGLAMNKNQPELRSAMNKALEQVIANGTYNKLIKKWFSHVPGLDWRSLEK
ncbi:amino acid ABC transporter periplasmic protein [Fructilactobacillus fructivorans]|nr:amino acid ABC transporter periplasmic protein [Fructilactobacillus fructivorans]